MEAWHREIVELHEFFERYFLGAIGADDLGRVDGALADGFTIVGPDGSEASREETVASIRAGHAHTSHLVITIADVRLLALTSDAVVARYVEVHQLRDRTNRRLSTVVFERAPDAPNGLRWRTVHETWLDR